MPAQPHEASKRQKRDNRRDRKRPLAERESTDSDEIVVERPAKQRGKPSMEGVRAEEAQPSEGRRRRELQVLSAPSGPDSKYTADQEPYLERITENPRVSPKDVSEVSAANALVQSLRDLGQRISPQLLGHWVFVIGYAIKRARVVCFDRAQPFIKALVDLLRRIILSEGYTLLTSNECREDRNYLGGLLEWVQHPQSHWNGRDIDYFVGQWAQKVVKRARPQESYREWLYEARWVLGGRTEPAEELAAIMRDSARWMERPLSVPAYLERAHVEAHPKPKVLLPPPKRHQTRTTDKALAAALFERVYQPFPRMGDSSPELPAPRRPAPDSLAAVCQEGLERPRSTEQKARERIKVGLSPRETSGQQSEERESLGERARRRRGRSPQEGGAAWGKWSEGTGHKYSEVVKAGSHETLSVPTSLTGSQPPSEVTPQCREEAQWEAEADRMKKLRRHSEADRGKKWQKDMVKNGVICKLLPITKDGFGVWTSAGIEMPQLNLRARGFLRNILFGVPQFGTYRLYMPKNFYESYLQSGAFDLSLLEVEVFALDESLLPQERELNRGTLAQWGILRKEGDVDGLRAVSLRGMGMWCPDPGVMELFNSLVFTIPAAVFDQTVIDAISDDWQPQRLLTFCDAPRGFSRGKGSHRPPWRPTGRGRRRLSSPGTKWPARVRR